MILYEPFDIICFRSLDAFIWDSTRLDFEAARHCQLRTRGALFGRSAYGVGLQKNSPWTPHITSAILRMTESGVMEMLDSKWIENKNSKCVVAAHKTPFRLSLWNMKDVFILVVGGVIFGVVCCIVEVIYGRKRSHRERERLLAVRYLKKWQQFVFEGHKPLSYNLSRPSINRRRLCLPRQNMDGQPVLHLSTFIPDLNFGRHPVVLFCSRCRTKSERFSLCLFNEFYDITRFSYRVTYVEAMLVYQNNEGLTYFCIIYCVNSIRSTQRC
ncbi:hypothetical protein DICVIV_05981 [Dictyocaulus viviparus]|uniref:Ionotropic glutamate receptor C-terminal domain-containing protein n=1 Tax=Dictyocaulus viviparus TaxID=29172 RepID=A0A0D8XVV9_DICVI|nr:hypothetical protein DICVIV_05981 [Dictyocaulus viviparus]